MVFGKLKVPDIIRAAGGEADVHCESTSEPLRSRLKRDTDDRRHASRDCVD